MGKINSITKPFIITLIVVIVVGLLVSFGAYYYYSGIIKQEQDKKDSKETEVKYEKTDDPNVVKITAPEEKLIEIKTDPGNPNSETIKVPPPTVPPPPPAN